ncbi:hypothetical protein ACFQZZ_19300 [Nocardia sp. GCM10030253]|uniref:hypothetical protein n=1 Tax=Nocardia sp. GCM10030253 TaxID=3273404 RepID=UPI0036360C91
MSIDLSFFRSETSQRIRAEGRAIGRAEGRAKYILRILGQRGIALPDDIRDRITTCLDLDQLDRWFDRSFTATTITDLFIEET